VSARVTAAVLNYDGRELLEVILPTLAAQDYEDFEILVLDNGSSDDSVPYMQEHWPHVRVLSAGPENVGVAAALNIAVAHAQGELVALLNNDIELEPGWLGLLVAALDRHPEAATAAGKLLSYYRRDTLDSTGDVFTDAAVAFGRGTGEVDCGQYDREDRVFAPTAGAALYRASALADVGPFDESFWAYFEDVDWGLRALIKGHSSWYVPAARGYHMGSRTTRPTVNRRYYRLQHRNTLGLLVKDVPARFIVRRLHRIVAHHLMSLLYSTRAGLLRAHLEGWAATLPMLPAWIRARRAIQRGARVSARELEAHLAKFGGGR
jgi:GT2 family glycosyltransferase